MRRDRFRFLSRLCVVVLSRWHLAGKLIPRAENSRVIEMLVESRTAERDLRLSASPPPPLRRWSRREIERGFRSLPRCGLSRTGFLSTRHYYISPSLKALYGSPDDDEHRYTTVSNIYIKKEIMMMYDDYHVDGDDDDGLSVTVCVCICECHF